MTEFAITVWQPWATLIAEGIKVWEFRRWPALPGLIGTRIGIHAGARQVRRAEVQELIYKLSVEKWREVGIVEPGKALNLLERVFADPRCLPRSVMLCTAHLGTPVRNQELEDRLGVPFVNDSDRDEHSNYGWPLSDVQRLEPFIPVKGKQGFWKWTPE